MKDKDFDQLSEKVGGRFKLCTLVIKRARMLMMNRQGTDNASLLNSHVIREALDEIETGRLQVKAADTPSNEDNS